VRVAFRTEGNHQQGMGDVMGSLALAATFMRDGAQVSFVVSGGEALDAIAREGHPVAIAASIEQALAALREFHADVIILNKLGNTPADVQALKQLGALVVTIDDAGAGAAAADLRINPLYHVADAITVPGFVALREEFQRAHERERATAVCVSELLVMQGGSDTYGFSPMIVRAVAAATVRPHCTVVAGPAFRHRKELLQAVAESDLDVTVVENPTGLAELMTATDLAITAGGLTMFELCCVGTPSLVVCAERFEEETAGRLDAEGAVMNLGFGGDLRPEALTAAVETLSGDGDRRQRMSERGRALVDGRGCDRIVETIASRMAALARRNA
jgi:UDP-2,4-diacetamido-2,4,6-trideoxy-beta-L-altropyranose hydrolase